MQKNKGMNILNFLQNDHPDVIIRKINIFFSFHELFIFLNSNKKQEKFKKTKYKFNCTPCVFDIFTNFISSNTYKYFFSVYIIPYTYLRRIEDVVLVVTHLLCCYFIFTSLLSS